GLGPASAPRRRRPPNSGSAACPLLFRAHERRARVGSRADEEEGASMGTRAGLVIGLGVGYVLGARAGRERYEDIRRWWGRASGSPVVQQSVEKMKDAAGTGARQGLYAVQHGVEKAGSAVRERLNKEGDPT